MSLCLTSRKSLLPFPSGLSFILPAFHGFLITCGQLCPKCAYFLLELYPFLSPFSPVGVDFDLSGAWLLGGGALDGFFL
jgi:hypothetical protein